METTNRLQELYYIARDHALVHGKGDFAALIKRDPSTFSHLWKNDGKANFEDAVIAAELALIKAGIAIDDSTVVRQSLDGRSMVANLSNDGDMSIVASLIKELKEQRIAKDMQIQRSQDQIDRLISILEDRGASLRKAQ